jgi:hypothetical protein
MCDCIGLCICLVASAFISYHSCRDCSNYARIENGDGESNTKTPI